MADANDLRQQAADLWAALQTPSLSSTPYGGYSWNQDLQGYDPYSGSVTPLTEMDPSLAVRQKATLSTLSDIANNGFTPMQKIQSQNLLDQGLKTSRQGQAAIMNSLASRGSLGSGAELAGRLAANDSAASATNTAGNSMAALALQNQLGALAQSGQLATNVRGQEANISNAQADILNNFNTQLQQLKTTANANNANVANQNTLMKQQMSNSNQDIANQNLDRSNTIAQTGFANNLSKTQGQGNALLGSASGMDAAQAAANMKDAYKSANTLGMLGLGVGALAQSPNILKGAQGISNLFGTSSPVTSAATNAANSGYQIGSNVGNADAFLGTTGSTAGSTAGETAAQQTSNAGGSGVFDWFGDLFG